MYSLVCWANFLYNAANSRDAEARGKLPVVSGNELSMNDMYAAPTDITETITGRQRYLKF